MSRIIFEYYLWVFTINHIKQSKAPSFFAHLQPCFDMIKMILIRYIYFRKGKLTNKRGFRFTQN